jgi:hypothetical protein
MASLEELVASVKKEIETWMPVASPRRYDTGYAGSGPRSDETVTKDIFEAAVIEIRTYVQGSVPKHSVRGAASLSGIDRNEWSILLEKWGAPSPAFDYHIIVSG